MCCASRRRWRSTGSRSWRSCRPRRRPSRPAASSCSARPSRSRPSRPCSSPKVAADAATAAICSTARGAASVQAAGTGVRRAAASGPTPVGRRLRAARADAGERRPERTARDLKGGCRPGAARPGGESGARREGPVRRRRAELSLSGHAGPAPAASKLRHAPSERAAPSGEREPPGGRGRRPSTAAGSAPIRAGDRASRPPPRELGTRAETDRRAPCRRRHPGGPPGDSRRARAGPHRAQARGLRRGDPRSRRAARPFGQTGDLARPG